MPPAFSEDASLVLIGMRCAGKSSLASIAAKALRWKVIDEKLQFHKATGFSVRGYIEKYGIKAYCAREVSILQSILEENPHKRIIVCSSSCVETPAGRELLHRHLGAMPIVHVMRDSDSLQSFLQTKWQGDVAKIILSQEPVYLACSNLTFFNTDDTTAGLDVRAASPDSIFSAVISPSHRPSSRSLSLKRVESDFLRFLDSVYGSASPPRNGHVASDPDVFNYALQLPFEDFKRTGFDLESFTCTADLLHVCTETLLQGYGAKKKAGLTWWEYILDQLAFLRRHTNQPIVYHARASPSDAMVSEDGSLPPPPEPDYFELVYLGLRTGVEFITLDLTQEETRLRAVTEQKRHCVIIGWLHDPNPAHSGGWMGNSRLSWYERAVSIGCDMVHMTQPATTPLDNELAQWFAQSINRRGGPLPVSAYNTGRMGRPSQCFNKLLTLVRRPDVAEEGPSDTVTIPQAQSALFSSFVCEPLNFAVMGATVQYSLAPILHTSAYRAYGMPHQYSIKPTDTLDLLKSLVKDDRLGGLGLSSPFKMSIISQLNCMSAEAQIIGAVNTIMPIRQGDGATTSFESSIASQRSRGGKVTGLYGENTDWKGIRSCAVRYLSPANAITSLSTALVIGAGGMARAAVYAMVRAGMKNICIYNRTYQHAIDLVNHFETLCSNGPPEDQDDVERSPPAKDITISILMTLNDPWPSSLRPPTIVVNCSPIPGDSITVAPPTHHGAVGPEPAVSIPDAWLTSPTGGVYMELAYNSITSSPELLRICAEDTNGWIGVAGLEIFIEVASAQFEFWTGRRAPKHVMMQDLRRHLRRMQEDVTK